MSHSIHIDIDELVLRGIKPEDARPVSSVLETELAELATAWQADRSVQSRYETVVRVPAITSTGTPPALGASVAEAVFSSLTSREGDR